MKNIVIIGGSHGITANLLTLLKEHQLYTFSRTPVSGVSHHQVFDVITDQFDTSPLPEHIHGVVYAPGTIQLKPFHRIKQEEFLHDLQVNTLGAASILQALYPKLVKSAGASVVLFSTVAVQQGMPYHSSIAMAKGAIEGLTRSLAAEWASQQIRVNAIAPSLTDTPLAEKLLNTEDKQAAAGKRHPLGRYGQAADIAAMARFLLSDESSWITGQILHIDGGMSSVRGL
jgi:NAD(P)-dependent dehydrogenase (short-subunit alcohol dehydrogenase family)